MKLWEFLLLTGTHDNFSVIKKSDSGFTLYLQWRKLLDIYSAYLKLYKTNRTQLYKAYK